MVRFDHSALSKLGDWVYLTTIVVALVACHAAYGQSNPNCFNGSLPPTDRITACNQVIGSDRGHAQAYQARALAWYQLQDYERAIEDFTQSISVDPKYIQAFYNRGLAWEKRGRLQNALNDFRYFASVNPNPDALAAVARVANAQKKIEEAAIRIANTRAKETLSAAVASPPINSQASGSASQGRRIALVIGNNAYTRVPQLEKAVGDADAVAQALRAIGFVVSEGTNLSFQQTAVLISEFEQRITKSDIVFFHFSGHGVQIKGDNILLPTDTPVPKDGQQQLVQRYGLSAEALLQEFAERGAGLTIAVLDACRDNPFAMSGTRGIGGARGLTALTPVEGTFVIYSAGVNQTALDKLGNGDTNTTSVFTRVMLPLLREPHLSLIEIAKRAQVKVRDLARTVGHDQTPAYYDQVVGNVTLAQ